MEDFLLVVVVVVGLGEKVRCGRELVALLHHILRTKPHNHTPMIEACEDFPHSGCGVVGWIFWE